MKDLRDLKDLTILEPEPAGGGRYKAIWKTEFKLLWREAGPPNHLDDKVESDQ